MILTNNFSLSGVQTKVFFYMYLNVCQTFLDFFWIVPNFYSKQQFSVFSFKYSFFGNWESFLQRIPIFLLYQTCQIKLKTCCLVGQTKVFFICTLRYIRPFQTYFGLPLIFIQSCSFLFFHLNLLFLETGGVFLREFLFSYYIKLAQLNLKHAALKLKVKVTNRKIKICIVYWISKSYNLQIFVNLMFSSND